MPVDYWRLKPSELATVTVSWQPSTRASLTGSLLYCVDVLQVADLVMTEFFDQGDKEKSELKIQPQASKTSVIVL